MALAKKMRAVWVTLLLSGAFLSMSGCSTLSYYAQSVTGHLALMHAAKPVAQWLQDEDLDPTLKERLLLAERIRAFAVSELKQPDNASYRRYANLQRPAVVWNVVAAPEFSLKLSQWCFSVVGCVAYRGYFDHEDAQAFADQLRQQGLDVRVYPVAAYSTLGKLPGTWFADPLLSTFIKRSEAELCALIFHELAHQVAYAASDTEFNESFATAVERLGVARWIAAHSSEQVRNERAQFEARQQTFRSLTARYRTLFEALYAANVSDADKRSQKQQLLQQMRQEYEGVKKNEWGGFGGYDAWFAQANNASLGLLQTYTGLTPHFLRLFERLGGDFDAFYAEVQRIAVLPAAQRRAALP